MTAKARQLPIDALKVIASQLIVLHHFSAYGPVADTLSQNAPVLMGWLYDYARMAVQVFLVVGGYLATASLAPGGPLKHRLKHHPSPLQAILKRYRRLVLPCLVALVLAVASAALARQWMNEAFIPTAPTWAQSVAHVFLLQGLLGHDALSAGVWYVAIDFQLFVLMTLLLWLGQRRHRIHATDSPPGPGLAQTAVLGLILASLFFFNRDPAWDNWALYFFGAYGMGAAAFWAGGSRRPALHLGLLTMTGGLALALDFRERIALALAVALLLGLWHWSRSSPVWRHAVYLESRGVPPVMSRLLHRLGQSSYALFLVHFPVLMLGNALFVKLGLSSPAAAAWTLLACWATSLALAQAFEHWVEAPLAR